MNLSLRFFRPPMAALTVVVSMLAGCQNKGEAPLPPRSVIAYEVRAESTTEKAQYSGEVRARLESVLGFRIAGKLIERPVEVGDVVRPGQLLARLDRTDPALAAQAATSLKAAAEAELALAQADARRFVALRHQNFVSQAVLDGKQAVLTAAEGRVAAARAQAESAGNQAAYAELRADSAGVVAAVLAEPGQVMPVGAPVVRVARLGEHDKEVLISVAENRVRDLTPGGEVQVSLWASGGKTYRGRIREVSPQADPVTRTFAARVVLLDADDHVRLGMTASVTLSGVAAKNLQVPPASIVQKDQRPAVWVIGDNGAITLRPVVVDAFRENGVFVSAGVVPGEKIVAAGAFKLMSGERVRIVESR